MPPMQDATSSKRRCQDQQVEGCCLTTTTTTTQPQHISTNTTKTQPGSTHQLQRNTTKTVLPRRGISNIVGSHPQLNKQAQRNQMYLSYHPPGRCGSHVLWCWQLPADMAYAERKNAQLPDQSKGQDTVSVPVQGMHTLLNAEYMHNPSMADAVQGLCNRLQHRTLPGFLRGAAHSSAATSLHNGKISHSQ